MNKKSVLTIIGIIAFLVAGNYVYWYASRDVIDVSVGGTANILQPGELAAQSTIVDKGNDEYIITGTVTDVFDDRPFDGDAGAIIDNRYKISVYGSGECQDCRTTPGYADEYTVGDTVEVYARGTLRDRSTRSYLSITSAKYYLRVQ